MGVLHRVENKVYNRFKGSAAHWTKTAVESLGDYYQRELDHEAAAVSFFAIFSLFPLLAFLVFVIGELTGNASQNETAAVVLSVLKELMPTLEGWIEQAVLDILRTNAVNNWLNAGILAWSGMRFFSALLTALSSIPESQAARQTDAQRSKLVKTALASVTWALFTVLTSTLVVCEFLARSDKIPSWLQGLPYAYQDVIYGSGRSGLLLTAVSVAVIATLFKLVLPCKLSMRSALAGAALFSGSLVLSRSAYWIYLHYQGTVIQSSYGAFSALVLNMLWIHFVVNCLLYSCLFALQLDLAKAAPGDSRLKPENDTDLPLAS